MRCLSIVLFIFAGMLFSENLWQDGSFESTGVESANAHSGSKVGIIKADNGKWVPQYRTNLTVEPFALYKATAWVRQEAGGEGICLANYTYDFDSFGWAFSTRAVIGEGEDWHQVTTYFSSPTKNMTFIPLVCEYNSKGIVAYIDDLVITRELSPEENLLALMEKKELNQNDTELLARYYLSKKDYISIKSLIRKSTNRIGADLACLLAKEPELAGEMVSNAAEMIRLGGLDTPEGHLRWNELYSKMTLADGLHCCLEANKLGGSATSIEKAVKQFVENPPSRAAIGKISKRKASYDALKQMITELDSNNKLLPMLKKIIDEESKKIDELHAQLGSLALTLGDAAFNASTYAIVLPKEATPSEKWAAEELSGYLEQITGESLAIITEGESLPEHVILIGRSSLLDNYGFTVDYDELGLEGICIELRNGNLLLAGGQRGCLYAVYQFLEDYLNCRWFTADCEYTPKTGSIHLDDFRKVKVPRLEYRDTDYPCCRPPEIGVRNRLNGQYSEANENWGGHLSYKGFVHTFDWLVPPSVYGESHPEYYSEINGIRQPEGTQLCLTNPDVLRIATETMKKWMRETPEATIFSISQNDRLNYCTCKKCTELAEKEGSQAGPLLHFVNAIANEVAKEFPDKIIDTLAYQYTRKPPKYVKPAPNVAVRLCSIECCFVHDLETDDFNKSFVDDIIGWSNICKRLHIWDYVINYKHSIMPFPNLRVLQSNIKFFLNHGVTGIYEEANYYSKGGELSELRSYILEKLLWDEDYPVDKAIHEFTENYYGAAGKFIREYLDAIHDFVCNNKDVHVRIYADPADYLNNTTLLAKCEALFQQAEAAVADNETLLHRVNVAHLPLIYTKNVLQTTTMKLRGNEFVNDYLPEGIDFFAKVAEKEGITKVCEGSQNSLEIWLAQFSCQKKAMKLETLANEHMRLSVLPSIGGRIWSAVDLGSGYEMMHVVKTGPNDYNPTVGGYEEYASAIWRSIGWHETFEVVEKGEDFIVLKADLRNGLSVTRRIELLKERSGFKVNTKYTAQTPIEKCVCRNHPEFNVPVPWEAVAFYKNADGSCTDIEMAKLIDRPATTKEHEIWLADKVKGEWGVRFDYNGKKAVIRQLFDSDKIGINYLNGNRPDQRFNLEQWSKPCTATPTEGPEFSSTYIFEIETPKM